MPPGRPRASRVAVLLDFLIRRFAAGSALWTAGLPVAAPIEVDVAKIL